MYLLLGEHEEVMELLEYSENRVAQILVELFKMENEGKRVEEFAEGLENVFGKENVKKALHVRVLKELFIDTSLHEDYENMLKLYDKLEIQKKASF